MCVCNLMMAIGKLWHVERALPKPGTEDVLFNWWM
jgi:hypothetical protein